MKKLRFIGMFIILGIIFFSVYDCVQSSPLSAGTSSVSVKKVAVGNNELAVDLYKKLTKKNENLFFSPYSISTALAMTYTGAKGTTAKQMEKTLHFNIKNEVLHRGFNQLMRDLDSRSKTGNYQLDIANRIWIQKGLNVEKNFLNTVDRYYSAGIESLNFFGDPENSRKIINNWVENKTRSKIKDLIPKRGVSQSTEMVLTNAIYFLGNWHLKFDERRTRRLPFHITTSKKLDILMMNKEANFKYKKEKDLQVLELPYKGQDLSMLILLPDKIDGITKLEKEISYKNLKRWTSGLAFQNVWLTLPKFKITNNAELSKIFVNMGMSVPFSPKNADFSGISLPKRLYISAIFHKAFVDVNEKGTEAAAATAVVMTKPVSEEMPKKFIVFRADHPFIFLILDNNSGSILFMGKLAIPL
jgi:serpin B